MAKLRPVTQDDNRVDAWLEDYGLPGRFNLQCTFRIGDPPKPYNRMPYHCCERPAMYVGVIQDRHFKKSVVYRTSWQARCGLHGPGRKIRSK